MSNVDPSAIDVRAIREFDIVVPFIFDGATRATVGGWDIPDIAPFSDADIVIDVAGHVAADGSGWIGSIEKTQFADVIDLVVLTSNWSISDVAAALLLEHLVWSREGKERWWD